MVVVVFFYETEDSIGKFDFFFKRYVRGGKFIFPAPFHMSQTGDECVCVFLTISGSFRHFVIYLAAKIKLS